MGKWRPGAILLISLTLLSVAGTLAMMPESALAQGQSLSGWLHVIWADPSPDANSEPGPRYVLIDDQDQWTEVKLDEDRLRPLGGPLAFNRKRVTVAGEWEEEQPSGQRGGFAHRRRLRVDNIQVEPYAGAPAAPLAAAPRAVTGSQPWVTILCHFADSATVTPRPKSYFDALLDPLLGAGVYPGLDHYWRQVSYKNVNIVGSVVVGWYNLPQPRSYYVYDQNGDGVADLDFQRAADDCTAAADADVFFPNFADINLMFDQSLDCCAWGGSTTLTKDGQTRSYGITWDPPWAYANQDVIGHEMGHGFGLRHSSGPYNTPYDSQWDIMSAGGRCSPRDAIYGCVAVHTISYHKSFLGWIPAARKFVPAPGSGQTIVLERLAQPMSSSNYLMAQIPIGGSTTQFYTVEARRFAGYDNQIPGEAVVIHKVDTTQSDRLAQVVDSDNNGNPNDAGARWTPGETFTDSANGIAVTVNAVTTAGFSVTVGYIGAKTAALVSAIAPVSRSVQVGNTATAYALILNYGTATALGCSLSPLSSLPAAFFFQALDCATYLPLAASNTPVDIAANGSGCFIFVLTPSSPIAPTDVTFNFDC